MTINTTTRTVCIQLHTYCVQLVCSMELTHIVSVFEEQTG